MKRLILLIAPLLLAACSSSISAAALAAIQPGMKVAEVEQRLGQPARIDQTETTGLTGLVYHYPSGEGDAQVIFINDQVFKAALVPGGKSS